MRNLAIVARAGKEFTFTGFEKDVQDRLIEGGIGGVAMRFPISVGEIELDASTPHCVTIYADGGIGKIWPGLAIPSAELYDLDLFAGRADETAPKIAGKPARLQFQFRKIALKREERAFANFRGGAQLNITFRVGHPARLASRRIGVQETFVFAQRTGAG